MIKSGLLSVTFRQLPAMSVIELAAQAGLDSIEWGGDIHLPPGDQSAARRLGDQTRAAGLAVSAYGSYYRVGVSEYDESNKMPFSAVLAAAVALRTPVIRVWAGRQGSAKASAEYRAQVVADSRRIADMAADASITVAYEYHGHTLTDTNESALQLLREVARDNVRTYWQPPLSYNHEQRLAGLRGVLPWLANLHVYHWRSVDGRLERRPLAEGREEWRDFFQVLKSTGREHFASLEFVAGDDPAAFRQDAAELKALLAG